DRIMARRFLSIEIASILINVENETISHTEALHWLESLIPLAAEIPDPEVLRGVNGQINKIRACLRPKG
ncbi:MAG: hypothetical protein K0Q59_5099, partial [Paenibacillus sp.]|nr:hypothetical protein [Paenibacillus sp.]